MAAAAVTRSELLQSRLDRFSRSLKGVEKSDSRALHRTRIASRRLRELVPTLQLPAAVTRKLSRRLRKVTRRLGTARELDVLLILIDRLHAARPQYQAALRRVRGAVAKERDAARRRQAERLPLDTMRRATRRLERALVSLKEEEQRGERHGPGPDKALVWAIDARVANRAARLHEALQDAGNVYLPERLHVVRLAVKKLRYALELRADARREPQAAALATLQRTQDLLGKMHDIQVLIDRVRDAQASLAPATLAGWRELDALVLVLDDMCRRMHGRYVRGRDSLDAVVARLVALTAAPARERRAG